MPKNRHLQNIVGTQHITDAAEQAIAAQAEGGATLAFKNVAVSGQSNIVADAATDTLNIAAGANVTITTNASTDTITIAATDTNTDTNTFRPVTAGGNTLGASETLAFTAGSNISISESAGAVTIASTGGSPVVLTLRYNTITVVHSEVFHLSLTTTQQIQKNSS